MTIRSGETMIIGGIDDLLRDVNCIDIYDVVNTFRDNTQREILTEAQESHTAGIVEGQTRPETIDEINSGTLQRLAIEQNPNVGDVIFTLLDKKDTEYYYQYEDGFHKLTHLNPSTQKGVDVEPPA